MSETPTYQVASEIRAEMARQRVTQIQLAERICMPLTPLRRRLTGETEISVNDLAAIATALGVPVTKFLPPDGSIAAEWYAALDAREERRQAQNGNAR